MDLYVQSVAFEVLAKNVSITNLPVPPFLIKRADESVRLVGRFLTLDPTTDIDESSRPIALLSLPPSWSNLWRSFTFFVSHLVVHCVDVTSLIRDLRPSASASRQWRWGMLSNNELFQSSSERRNWRKCEASFRSEEVARMRGSSLGKYSSVATSVFRYMRCAMPMSMASHPRKHQH